MSFFILLWPITQLPKTIQLFALGAIAVALLRWQREFEINKWIKLLFVYLGMHTFSVCVNMVAGEHETERIFATINMLMIWLVAVLIMIYFSNAKLDLMKVGLVCFANVTIMDLLVVWYLLLEKRGMLSYTVPMTGTALFINEWVYTRFNGLMEYATLVSAWQLLFIGPACAFLYEKVKVKSLVVLYYLVGFLPVYFNRSRNGYVLYFLIACLFFCVWFYQTTGIKTITLIGGIGLTVTAVKWATIASGISVLVEKLLGMREGSNGTRSLIYEYTWNSAMESPIIGKGIKDMTPMGYPYGSHCSYLGFFYKTGILGTALIFAIIIGILYVIWMTKKNTLRYYAHAICPTVFFLFMFFEDVDGANWLLCLLLALLGLLLNPNIEWEDKGKQGEEI